MSRLPKQIIWSVLLWLIIGFDAWANSSTTSIKATQEPELYSIRVIPSDPTTKDAIQIQIWSDLNLGILANTFTTRYTINGNVIKIQTNQPLFFDPGSYGYITTLIDPLQAGNYTIEYEYRQKTFLSSVSPIKDDADFVDVIPKRTIIPLTIRENIHRIPSLSSTSQTLLSLLIFSIIAWFNRRKLIFS